MGLERAAFRVRWMEKVFLFNNADGMIPPVCCSAEADGRDRFRRTALYKNGLSPEISVG